MREWHLHCGCTIASSRNTDELGQWLHIGRRSTLRISPIAERLVEPSIAAAHSHAALLASGLPRKAEARDEAVQGSAILVVTLVGAYNYPRRGRAERLARIGVDSVRIVVGRRSKSCIRAGSRRNGHCLQQGGPSVAKVPSFAKRRWQVFPAQSQIEGEARAGFHIILHERG